jgi:hypothetical protein
MQLQLRRCRVEKLRNTKKKFVDHASLCRDIYAMHYLTKCGSVNTFYIETEGYFITSYGSCQGGNAKVDEKSTREKTSTVDCRHYSRVEAV